MDSIALTALDRNDVLWVDQMPVPPGVELPPRKWAEAVFAVRSAPRWVISLFALRQALVPLLGISRGGPDTFAVREVRDGEALVMAREGHLDFATGVAQREGRLVVTTAVRFRSRAGRVYLVPVRALHHPVVRAMMRRAIRRAALGAAGASD